MARITDSFKEQVYAVVEQIPCGKVLSYQSVAVLAGYPRYARQVGYVLRQVPSNRLLPCHRVVTSIGVGSYRIGPGKKSFYMGKE